MATVSDFREANKLRRILAILAEYAHDMPLSYSRVMLEVMLAHLKGGEARSSLTQRDLLDRLGVEQSTLSRALGALSDRRQNGSEPYRLVDISPDPRDLRYNIVRLNARGVALLNQIISTMEA